MTVMEVFGRGLAMLPTNVQEDAGLVRYAPQWVNMALSEAFEAENSVRLSRGEELLEAAPVMGDPGEEIPYCERIVSYALPYFIASQAAKDDEDMHSAEDFRARYIVALRESSRAVAVPIIDNY